MEDQNNYLLGYHEYWDGTPYNKNPHPPGTEAHTQWKIGWISADWHDIQNNKVKHEIIQELEEDSEKGTLDTSIHVFWVAFALVMGLGTAFITLNMIYLLIFENA